MSSRTASAGGAGQRGLAGRLRRRLAGRALRRHAGLLPAGKCQPGSAGLSTAAVAYVTAIEDDLRRLVPAIREDPHVTEK